ncbi:MAG: hypothetical protein RL015_3299 [Verrucomicrobiota bacterium]|jgi:hypothetical protein
MNRCSTLFIIFAIAFYLAQPSWAVSNAVVLKHQLQNRVLTVAAAPQIQQVVLEQKTSTGWKPVSVAYPAAKNVVPSFNISLVRPAPRSVSFKLNASQAKGTLRAVGYRGAKFPSRFQRGQRSFDRQDLEALPQFGVLYSKGGQPITSSVLGTDAAAAAVIESDIWQIVGDQIYFFNQYRGLQILDMSDPTAPVRTGSLRLPASGEQMFVLNAEGTEVALLGRSNDKARQGAATVWLIRIIDGMPNLISEVPLEGAITDSRLIGRKLHVLCSSYSQSVPNLNWQGEAVLTSLDLADLDAPHVIGSLRTPSNYSVLQASGGHLLVGTTSYYNAPLANNLHIIDITNAPVILKTFSLRGQVQDKFKLSLVNGAVVAVTLNWQNWNNRQTWVETFPVAGSAVTPLASLELEGARGESLHATRFDGDRLYVVTFLQIDPLFIVDLADPAAPVLSGVLEVPGWSTYLEPLGDRLLAVGVEDGRVTVSLFDVSDVTAPALLSRLPLGPEGSSSWSEANYDEKAVEFLSEEGVIMVPFESWDWSSGHATKAIQIVNLAEDTLSFGTTIQHDFNPRRGSLMGGHFVSLSGQELLVHSTEAGVENPLVVRVPLAWRADRVVPFGDFLVQIEDGETGWNYWNGFAFSRMGFFAVAESKLRITTANDPDTLLEEIPLGQGRVVGVTQKNGRLYLAQLITATATTPQRLRTLALELGSPPTVTEVGRSEHDLTGLNFYSMNFDAVQPHWMSDSSLVWFIPMQTHRFFWGPIWLNMLPVISITQPVLNLPAPVILPSPVNSSLVAAKQKQTSPPVTTNPAAVLCPVQVGDSALTARTALNVFVNGNLRNISTAFSDNGFLFFSYDTGFEKPQSKPVNGAARPLIPYAPSESRLASWLQVIDWRSASPTLRDPVSIPGQLMSVADVDAQGAVLLTHRNQRISSEEASSRSIQASGYDGVTAWLLDSYITATSYHQASVASAGRVYLARDGDNHGVVGIAYNLTTGRLSQISTWTTNATPQMLSVNRGHLIASSFGNLELASLAPASGQINPLASYETPTNLWLQVNRAVITPALDIWIPAGDYGVEFLQHDVLAP